MSTGGPIAQSTGRIALRIHVYQQRFLVSQGESGRQIDRRRRFSDAALLIGNTNDPGQNSTASNLLFRDTRIW